MYVKTACRLVVEKPAETFRLDGGQLKVGAKADFVVIDLHTTQVVDPTTFVSKGKIRHLQAGRVKDGRR